MKNLVPKYFTFCLFLLLSFARKGKWLEPAKGKAPPT
jgi:hypothetical protein